MSNLGSLISEKKALVFDLFHTLTSPEAFRSGGPSTSELLGVTREAWNEQLLNRSRERLAGEERDPVAIVRRMARAIDPAIPDDLIEEVTGRRMARFKEALVGIPDANRSVLLKLRRKGKKIGLLSNADVTEIAGWPDSPISDLFDSVIFSCDVGYVKPEREIYELSIGELGVGAGDCVFVGDGGSRELEGARAVGMATVMMTGVIKGTWPERIEERRRHADFVIDSLEGLLHGEGEV